MTLTDLQLSQLRAADGLASADEEARLLQAGFNPADWRWLRVLVAEALADPDPAPELVVAVLAELGLDTGELGSLVRQALHGGRAPDVVAAVMAALDLHDDLGQAVRGALDAGDAPDLTRGVMRALEFEDGRALGRAVRGALTDDDAPDFAHDVMAALGLDGGNFALGDLLRGDGGEAPDLTGDVLEDVGLFDRTGHVRDLLREEVALAVSESGDIAAAVLAELGLEDADADIGEALADPAGGPDDLWGAIAAELGMPEQAEVAARDEGVAASSEAEVVRPIWWRLPAVGLAAAAALLLFVTGAPTQRDNSALAFELSDVNHVEIEDISTDSTAMVQVLQFDEDAPAIIFIDVIDDPDEGLGPDDEGTTL